MVERVSILQMYFDLGSQFLYLKLLIIFRTWLSLYMKIIRVGVEKNLVAPLLNRCTDIAVSIFFVGFFLIQGLLFSFKCLKR